MKKKEKAKRQKPRLPEEGRNRIRQGGAHPDKKKKYRREKNRAKEEGGVRDDNPDVFFVYSFINRSLNTFFWNSASLGFSMMTAVSVL